MPRYRETPEARADLFEIWSYIEADNPAAARRVLERIANACDRLVDFPCIGRNRDDLRSGLRSWVTDNYLVFYTITGEVVEIVRVLHGARDIEAILGDKEP